MPEISSQLQDLLIWILLGASLLPIVWILAFYCPRIASVGSAVRRQAIRDRVTADKDGVDKNWPGVSVIVYSAGVASALERLLPTLMEQEYPGNMEVIVVNDGRNEAVKDVVTLFRNRYRNLYVTFTPEESRNLSRKKLSLTLGIKAARYDNVVLTEERAHLSGNLWLRHMAAPLVEDSSTQIVIGYSAPMCETDKSFGAKYRSFDHAVEGVAYLSSALNGRPWRGTSFNLAYRKDLFFRNKGFGHSLNLQTGDDDIFVSEVANADNCVVEVAPDSLVFADVKNPQQYHRNERTLRAFSATRLARRPSLFFGFSSAMMWLWLFLSIGIAAIGWQQWWTLAAVAGSACLMWIPVMGIWHSTLKALQARTLLLTVPWLLMRRPFTNMRYRRYARRHRQQNYTWSVPK